ncbi:hypothetical protein H2203_008016 [Taxawa tesnikishii (nom. ined.)]|nr:hypothetical protein H2203_008016 [Dothideales sp. JES 119]
MVNEREPASAPSNPYQPSPQKSDRQPLSPVFAQAQPPRKPGVEAPYKPSVQPEFGKASPLRNPLRQDYSNVFNPNKGRAEHHRPAPNTASRVERPQPLAGPGSGGFYLPGQKPQPISVPTNAVPKTTYPPSRPMFSSTSIGAHTRFETFQPRNTIDLTKTEDDFDPDAALRDDRFGAVDPYSYIDSGQTNENIKALLEGAFDDDEEKPKHRLRKRTKKTQVEEKKLTGLEARLQALAVKDEEKKEEPNNDEEEEEDGTVEGLSVKLLPHQVDGVAWMIDKEIGERKKNGVLPKGGILADDMGLGKTVQSVTLILTNPRPALDAKPDPDHPKRKMPGKEVGKGTLVVAPLALIKQWEAEIKSKVESSHALKVLVHHGPSRTKSHSELKKYDVVITTYQILASEHAGSSDHPDGLKVGCFGVHWYRVILDEAHSIKNRNAKSTQACYALRSWYRWCLTGTPMQNNLDELQSLIRFLGIKPYNELGPWKDQITNPMKNGRGHIAIKRIQYFLKAFMKRRTKDILKQEGALNFGGKPKDGQPKNQGMKIVERKVETVICELDAAEREFYDRLQERAEARLQDMMGGERTDYIGALVLLLRLRQACNHPKLIDSAMNRDKDALSTGGLGSQTPRKMSKPDDDMDDIANMLGGLSVASKNCEVCQVDLDPSEAAEGGVRCKACESIAALGKSKKHHEKVKKGEVEKEENPSVRKAPKMRNRKIITDSEDEDEEGEGEWLVSKSKRNMPDLGKAGGTDDEDAEGGGDTLGSIDSVTDDEEDASEASIKRKDDSFISHETESEPELDSPASSDNESDSDSDSSGDIFTSSSGAPKASTKIRHLLRILHAETPVHKTIVFSQFTSMLDLIEPHLKHANICFVRYDGGMRNDAREASLHSLRTDPKTRVLLCSLKCGSLGLNLTAASRVVIVEPFWNPFVEEQAIDRVHRLNQTVDVRVFKLTTSETVEEKILALQEKKRELAKAAIEGGKAAAKLSMKDILSLFGRDAEVGGGEEGLKWSLSQKEKVLDSRPSSRTVPAPVSSERRRQMEKGRSRISSEDPVYGRR